eukprot:2277907-Pleurochrysis_carterae.AAC.1
MVGAVQYSGDDKCAGNDTSLPWLKAFEKVKEAAATEVKAQADDEALCIIRRRYGESSERLLAMLLTLDALFDFGQTIRVRFDSYDLTQRDEEHAILFAQKRRCYHATPIDRTFWEQFARVTVGRHKPQYPHKAAQQNDPGGGRPLEFLPGALDSYHAEWEESRTALDASASPRTWTVTSLATRAP